MLDHKQNRKVPLTLRDKMTREQLKKWFDKLPTCNVHKGRQRLVTWEDIKRLAQRIEATKEDK